MKIGLVLALARYYHGLSSDSARFSWRLLIPAAMIPCLDFEDALAECQRVADKGFAAFCLWEGLTNYTDARWDPIFALAAEKGIPLVFHTGVGDINSRALKGPGGALYNYTRQMNDAVDVITQLVAGGVLDRNPGVKLSDIRKALPVAFTSLTMSPHCGDEVKYGVVAEVVKEYEDLFASGGSILGRKITEVITVNGVRVHLEDGSWVLVRASSNKPEVVVVVESTQSEDDMRALFRQEVKPRLGGRVGKYNQEI